MSTKIRFDGMDYVQSRDGLVARIATRLDPAEPIEQLLIADGPLLGPARWKQHDSLHPAGGTMLAAFKTALTPYRFSEATLRLPLSTPVPVTLIEPIAKFRAREVARRARRRGDRRLP